MKSLRIPIVTLLILFFITPRYAVAGNWVDTFLARYHPPANALPPTAPPQESATLARGGSIPLTLEDVIQMMLSSNLNINVDRLPPQISRFLIDTYLRPYDPTLHISANGQRSNTVSTSQLSGAPSLIQLTQSYDVGIGQTLMTGTSYGVDVIMNRNSSNNAFASFNPSWVGQVRYSISQHLLQNRGRLPGDHLIRVARNNQDISESQFEQQMMDLVSQAQNTYWDYVYSLEDIKVKQHSVELARTTLNNDRKEVEAGLLAPLDVVQAEAQVATMEDALVVSTYTSQEVEDALKKTITAKPDPGLVLARLSPVETLTRPADTEAISIEQAIQAAWENRPEMKQVRLGLTNARIDAAYTKNQMLPVLDISAGYSQNGLGGVQRLRSTLGGSTVTGIIPGGLGDAFSQLFGFGYNTYSFGFNLQIPLSNKAARSDHDRAVGTQELASAQVDAVAQQIALDVRNAMKQLEMNRAHIESAGKAREFAQQTLDAEQKKLQLGVSTLFFVLQDQTNLAAAETNQIQAIVNYNKARVALDRATGQTLLHNHIEIENANPTLAASAAHPG